MELRQLRYFTVLADELHFTRAAARLHLAQSALSASIGALERELDALLVVRDRRGLRLTQAGRTFLTEARRTLAAAESARTAVAAVQGVLAGTLSVGYMLTSDGYDLAALLGAFRRAHPGVQIQLRNAPSTELIERVQDDRLDLAFVAHPGTVPPGLRTIELVETPMPLLCPPGHPLAGRHGMTLAELREEDFVDFVPGWGARVEVDQVFEESGVERNTALEVNDIALAVDLVAQGLGVAFVPPGAVAPGADVRAATTTPAPLWRVGVVHPEPERTSAAARAFLRFIDAPEAPDAH